MEPGKAKEILDKLLYDLYEVPISVVYDYIAKIVKDNIETALNIVDDDAVRFIRFEGEIYFSSNLSNYKDRQSIIYDTEIPDRHMVMLDETKKALLPEIAELKLLASEQKECAHYLRILLNQCKSLYDVKALLPGAAWHLLGIKLDSTSDITVSFTKTELATTLDLYTEDAESVKERIFLNLLLKKA